MSKSSPKLALSASRDIPFDKLVLSQSNVRRIKAGVGIEDLAEDIARRTLLQSLTVRAVVDTDGNETGMFEVPSGGRRYRALELLVKRKKLPRNAPVPCIVRTAGDAEEDSLAENIQRAPLHPLDQFRAFLALREKGQSEEEIAAHQFVSVAVVKQRLKLASVSPKILDAYAEDAITLDQLMAFTVNGDHERQEQVFERLAGSYDNQPYAIRRMLTEGAVRASDKRARFIDIDAYVEAGGSVMRDLFQGDDGGWLQDVGLVDLMVSERLREEAMKVQAEGWRWIDAAPDFPYGHTYGLRQLRGMPVAISAEEQATRDALQAEYDALIAEYEDAPELPDEVDERLGELETAIEALDQRPLAYDADEVARAGAFVSIAPDGSLRIERGFVRPEDELPVEPEQGAVVEADQDHADNGTDIGGGQAGIDSNVEPAPEPEEDEGLRPIPDRLVSELTAHRTLALRDAVARSPEVAFHACLHALVLRLFYRYALDSCLELEAKHVGFGQQAPGLGDTASAQAIDARHQALADLLPAQPEALWNALGDMDGEQQKALFAHCVASTVNATFEAYNRRPRALAHADRLAQAVDLDMAAAGWTPTVDTFLGRVTKARIVQAVTEAKGERTAEGIAHLKKGDMAARAAVLLEGSGWLPEPLRTPGRALPKPVESEAESPIKEVIVENAINGEVSSAEDDGTRPVADEAPLGDNDMVEGDTPFAVAAE
ncbi:DNA-binding protein [Hyphomonas sp. CACIAM 19H1]|uniref:ParB/RepB/Spo0J family partition protein n=1 Tax=Hyphomonas sp. CACIAM 19H1 TaxID=1873716 RepID=UPI000DED8164|nr:ParB/RepB/Spo0J family partition protein [Hyphomonas sp. CACIAM 19H1]AXE65299.1 DNA-binding protein [Hyphomonas sp. CACIAM 19H1]